MISIKNFLLFFFTEYKDEWKEHKFWQQKSQKSDFYKNKKIFNIDDFDVNKILVFKKEPYGIKKALKYFIEYNDNDVVRPLCLRLSQITGYTRKFDKNVTMSLRVKDKQLLKNYNKIWKKTERLMSIYFDSKLVYGDDDKYIKTKIKTYEDSKTTNVHNKKRHQKKKYHANVYQ